MMSQIGKGLCVLIGISRNDKTEDSDYMSVNNNLFKLFFLFKTNFKIILF
jgi:D-Tyr-tRNAtyr deacylase